MKRINESEVPFKYETTGPKYMFREEGYSGGVAYLDPAGEIKEHAHDDESEVFYFIEGSPKFIASGSEFRVKEGDGFMVVPGEKHGIINDTDKTVKLTFLKIKQGDK